MAEMVSSEVATQADSFPKMTGFLPVQVRNPVSRRYSE
jgi:hypothetical protein